MRIITRYIFLKTLIPVLAFVFAFLFLWIIYDMFDNFSDFVEAHAPASMIFDFYFQQVPRAIAIGLPVAVLLACLYSLINLSKTSEFVAMQACGVSIVQIGMPYLVIGLLTTGALIALNWEWNPKAVRNRENILNRFRNLRELAQQKRSERNIPKRVQLDGVVYRSKDSLRLWFVYKADIDAMRLRNIEILQMAPSGHDLWKYYAGTLTWKGKDWQMTDVLKVTYDEHGNAAKHEYFEVHHDPVLTETFDQVSSTILSPEVLSVPELKKHLADNSDLTPSRLAPFVTYYYYRLFIGWSCLATTLIALPFAMTASRRDLLAGFSRAITMYFAFLTCVHFFLALGKGNRIPGLWAGTVPVLLFSLIGLLLFIAKSRGWKLSYLLPAKPIPSSFPPNT